MGLGERAITLKEMQRIEFELLIVFDAFCTANDLRYFIDGGTLLGAMCYKGFIPWDDDIDLKMPRPDYERFLKLADELPEYVQVLLPSGSREGFLFTKLIDNRTLLIEHANFGKREIGVYIDILPMDGWPEDDNEADVHINKLRRLNSLYHYSKTGFGHGAKAWLRRLLYSGESLRRQLDELARLYPYDDASRVGLLVEGDPYRERFEKSWLEPAAELEFMGRMFPAPNAYEKHLQVFYGNNITEIGCRNNLPRVESKHDYEAYWKD